MNRLKDKVAIITGGSTGIGFESARLFLAEGAKVAIFARSQANLDKAFAELNSENLITIQGDVANLADIDRLLETTHQKFGKINILFLNAGIAPAAPLGSITEKMFDDAISTNLKSPLFTIQKALTYLEDGSSIVLTASISNQIGQHSLSVYAASKAGLRSLARGLSHELIPRKIRVNVVSPGVTDTPILEKVGLEGEALQNMIAFLASQNPTKRIGKPEEIAQAVLFLASDESSYVIGSEINVDGGFTYVGTTS